jgi:pimeloyl-ACP methyl ester carboxylesterase
MIYRHMLQTASGKNITDNSIVVCVDLPGYGGSDSFKRYGADEVLEALTEFVIGMRTLYGSEDEEIGDLSKTYILSHDWGCVLAYRLAAEAPALADRFILTNGPHVELALANKDRMISSAAKIFKQVSTPLGMSREGYDSCNSSYPSRLPAPQANRVHSFVNLLEKISPV